MRLPEFQGVRILVAGDVMLDRYWFGPTSRISPEAPVPVVRVEQLEERAGGAGNVALNMARLGCRVTLLGCCGSDEAADSVRTILDAAGVACRFIRSDSHPTVMKLRVVSRHQQLLRLDFETPFAAADASRLAAICESEIGGADLIVLSDYDKGSLGQIERIISAARRIGKPVLVDPKSRDFSRYRGATLLTPNLSEFEAAAGRCDGDAELARRAAEFIEQLDLRGLLITRGEQGMSFFPRGGDPLHLQAHAKEVYDVTGAGDTVLSVLAAAYAAGQDWRDATRLANLAAGIVVGKLGTASVSSAELDEALGSNRAARHGVVTLDELSALVSAARRRGERIVLTNGCFDLLHMGHVAYLRTARELGDRLVVLVNSDESVRRLKGENRPLNSLDNRMGMLAALECVDWVCAFDDDTPREAICRILPDVLVKGGDYRDVTQIAGHDCVIRSGGEVRTLDFVEGLSTSGIIAAIRGEGDG